MSLSTSSSSLSSRSTFRITRPSTSSPPLRFLGGTLPLSSRAASGVDDVLFDAASSPLSALPRPLELSSSPPFELARTKNPVVVKAVFDKFWKGDFEASCWLDDDDDDDALVIEAGIVVDSSNDGDDDDGEEEEDNNNNIIIPAEFQGPMLRLVLTASYVELPDGSKGTMLNLVQKNSNDYNQEFLMAMEEKLQRVLYYRVLHHVVRQHGAKLVLLAGDGGRLFGFDVACNNACKALVGFYTTRREINGDRKKVYDAEALDVRIIMADLALRTNQTRSRRETIMHALYKVGDQLQAMEQYAQAAELYLYTNNNYMSDGVLKRKSLGDVALAYKRAGNIIRAEELYIEALYLTYCSAAGGANDAAAWDLNNENDGTFDLVHRLMTLYNNIDKLLSRAEATEEYQVLPALMALLHVAGYQPKRGNIVHTLVTGLGGTYSSYLHPQYQRRKIAKKTIGLALDAERSSSTSPSLRRQNFRATIEACWQPGVKLSITRVAQNETTTTSIATEKERQKRAVLKSARQNTVNVHSLGRKLFCSYPICNKREPDGVNFKCCPCQSTFYCQKECQRKHWKSEHRKLCPLNNTNN